MKKIRFVEGQVEKIEYTEMQFPVYVAEGHISEWLNYYVSSHLHDDLEIIVVKSGKMFYRVNDEEFELTEGQGVVVNSRQIHNNYSKTREECVYECVLINPFLMASVKYIEENYIKPIIYNKAFCYCKLDTSVEWKQKAIDIVWRLSELEMCKDNNLKLLSAFYEIWDLLYQNVADKEYAVSDKIGISEVKLMLEYIYEHYQGMITLSDIAIVGGVGKTHCINLFRRYLGKTPVEFIIDYKLQKAAELLRNTNLNVTEISYETGFSSSSYFSKQFRQRIGCTPKEYRKSCEIGK